MPKVHHVAASNLRDLPTTPGCYIMNICNYLSIVYYIQYTQYTYYVPAVVSGFMLLKDRHLGGDCAGACGAEGVEDGAWAGMVSHTCVLYSYT